MCRAECYASKGTLVVRSTLYLPSQLSLIAPENASTINNSFKTPCLKRLARSNIIAAFSSNSQVPVPDITCISSLSMSKL